MSESRSAWARSCSTCPAAITAIIAWLANTRRACRRDGEGSSLSAGSSAQMRPTTSPASSWSGTTSQWWSQACGPRPFMVEVKALRWGMRATAVVWGIRKQPSTSKAGSSSGRISSTETRQSGASASASQPATARALSSPVSGSTSSIITFWKSSAPETPSQTSCSTSSIERRSDSREETCSSCSSAMRWRAASTASWAPCRARAVSDTMATSRSSWSSDGRMPDTGSPTETMPSR